MQISNSKIRRRCIGGRWGSVATGRPFASALSRKIGTEPPMKYGPCILRTDSTPISVRYTSIPSHRWNSTVTSDAYKFPNARLVISDGHQRYERREKERSTSEPDRAGFIHGSPCATWTDNSLSPVCLVSTSSSRLTRADVGSSTCFLSPWNQSREQANMQRGWDKYCRRTNAVWARREDVSREWRLDCAHQWIAIASYSCLEASTIYSTRGTWHRRFILSIGSECATWDSSSKNIDKYRRLFRSRKLL